MFDITYEDIIWGSEDDQVWHFIVINNRRRLISYLNELKAKYNGSIGISARQLLEWALIYCSDDCVVALLEERDLKLHPDILTPKFMRPMHHAALWLNPRLVDVFLRYGCNTSIRWNMTLGFRNIEKLVYDPFNPQYEQILPLELALRSFGCQEYSSGWAVGHSIFELILILCLPINKEPLEAIRMLAQSTKEIDEVVYHIAKTLLVRRSIKADIWARDMIKETTLVELAALLMVAREKVLGPIEFRGKSYKLHQLIQSEIRLQIDEEVKIVGRCQSMKSIPMFALQLLKVFEKAGDAIGEYLKSQQPNVSDEQVAKKVTSLLVAAGFNLEFKDTYLRDIHSCYIPSPRKSWADKESLPGTCYYIQPMSGSYRGRWRSIPTESSNGYPDLSSTSLPFSLISVYKMPNKGHGIVRSKIITKKKQLLRDFIPAKRLVKIASMIKWGKRCL